jgi:hypothetical protein
MTALSSAILARRIFRKTSWTNQIMDFHMSSENDHKLLKAIPTLDAYIARAGAKQKSLRRYVVEGEKIYGRQRRILGSLDIDQDGLAHVRGDLPPLSDEDQTAIKAEIKAANLPHSTAAAVHGDATAPLNPGNGPIFKFLSLDGDSLLFM